MSWPVLFAAVAQLLIRERAGGHPLSLALIGLTPLLGLGLVVAVVGAWRGRSATLRGATAAVTGIYLAAMNPASAVVGCHGSAPADAITVYSANVLVGQGRPHDIATSILDNQADIVLLQEVNWDFLDDLRNDPRLTEAYPHRAEGPDGAPLSGQIVWSRWPLGDLRTEPFVVSQLGTVTVESPQGPIELINIHTDSPSRVESIGPWHAQFHQLNGIATDRPTIMAGDFNATGDHRPFRTLLDQGWTDAHEPKGCGFDATWPARLPVLRLDHVLVTDHFEVLDVRLADPAGSDHLPVVAELRLGGPSGGSGLDSRPVSP